MEVIAIKRKRKFKKRKEIHIEFDEILCEIDLTNYRNVENDSRAKGLDDITEEEWKKFEPEVAKNKRYIDEWLRDIVKPNKSEKTYKQYKSCIRQFAFWNEKENDGTSFHKLKKRAFVRYQNYLLSTGMSKATISLKRNAVSSFCNFLEIYISEEDDKYEAFRNFVKGTEIPQAKDKVYNKIPVTFDEFNIVKDKLLDNKKYRLYAIWVLLFYTGKRIEEVLQLKLSDIRDIPEGAKFIMSEEVRAKGHGIQGKRIQIRLNSKTIDAVRVWLPYRKSKNKENPYIFCDNEDKWVNSNVIRNGFTNIISPILNRRINPHLLRGSFATYLLNQGVSLTVVQQLLSHSSVETTANFYDLRRKEDLINQELENIDI